MGKDGKKRRRSVGKLETRGNRPQAEPSELCLETHEGPSGKLKARDTVSSAFSFSLKLTYHSENRSLRAELVNERNERWHTVQACLPRRP